MEAFLTLLNAQVDCNPSYVRVFGSLIEKERGYSLSASLDKQAIYVGGIKGDSAVLLKVKTTGEIEWTRTFDVVPGKQDHIFRVLTDTDDMIAVSGIAGSQQGGGTVFVFRYNPETNEVLWTKELISTSTNFNLGMIEIGPGGNYLVTNNPSSPNNAELVEINKNTGNVVSSFSKHYDLGSSESIYDLVYHEGQLYGSARFSDGGTTSEMRNTLMKIDPDDGSVLWMKLGHKPASQSARLYGLDLVIVQEDLFSIYVGDGNGTSIDNTDVYIQRTTTDGELKWLKHYELPGNNDWADEIISSNGGLVILARNRVAPSDFILFKIDYEGDVIWARKFDYTNNDNAVGIGSIQSQLIEADDHYYFTAFAEQGSDIDLILARTDLSGRISDTCSISADINIAVSDVNNPVFYAKAPIISTFIPQVITHSLESGLRTSLQTSFICSSPSHIISHIDHNICLGEMFEEYSQSGFYTDTFTTQDGCDSIRYLNLIVLDQIQSSLTVEICSGQDYEGYTQPGIYQDTFISVFGCDSICYLNLTVMDQIQSSLAVEICSGQEFEGYTQPGIYQDTFITVLGCDSIRILNLSIIMPENHIQREICSGTSFEGYTLPGIYIDTIFSSSGGCDSVQHLTLFVSPPIQYSFTKTICLGDTYDGYSQDGFYTDTFTTQAGCDSIRHLNLTLSNQIQFSLDVEICPRQIFEGYTQPGIYQDTFMSAFGCDSVRTLNLSITIPEKYIQHEICSGASFGGYTQPGMYIDTIVSTNNECDTVQYLELLVTLPIKSNFPMTICEGSDYFGYTSPGVYIDSFSTSKGCDSIRTIFLDVQTTSETIVSAPLCEGYKFGHFTEGTYIDTLLAVNGCDSIITLHLEGISVFIPNVFSPNEDLINDIYYITLFPENSMELVGFSIFDRWGNLVHQDESYPVQWDGKGHSGQYLNPGVFTYLLIFHCQNQEIRYTGDITLIR